MDRATVFAVTAVFAIAGLLACFLQRPTVALRRSLLPIVAVVTAASLLALAPAAAVLPKATPEGVTLAASIFDHSKIALVDEMIRAGVPPKNPFFSEAGVPDGVAYYYLWHFSAAVIAVMTGASGWEADAALVWFTALASLLTMVGLAARLAGKMTAGFVVIVLAAAASVRALLEWTAPDVTNALMGKASGLGGWLFQMAWAPQHLASATCVVLACLLLVRLAQREDWFAPLILGLVAAAGFQCSIWVGGVTFALGATLIALYLLWSVAPESRLAFVLRVLAAAALALAISFPFIRDQIAVAASRGGGRPDRDCTGRRPGHGLSRLPAAPSGPSRLLAALSARRVRRRLSRRPGRALFPAQGSLRRLSQPTDALAARSPGGNQPCRGLAAAQRHRHQQRSRMARDPAGTAAADRLRRGGDLALAPSRSAPLRHPRDLGCRLDAAGHAAIPARGLLRVAHAVRTAVRGDAVDVAGGATACGTRRADRQQSAVPGRHDAVAHQHFLGAAGQPAFLLCRQRARRSVRANPGCRAYGHRGTLRSRLCRRAGRRRYPRAGGSLRLRRGRGHARGRRLEARSVRLERTLSARGNRAGPLANLPADDATRLRCRRTS